MKRMPLVALATAQFLVVLSTSIVNVALPAIRTGLGVSEAGLSWVVNAYVLVFGALLLLGGRAGDVHGLRRVFLIGTGLFALASLAAAVAPGDAALITARALQGLGAALLAPTALGLVLTLYPGGRALGVWGAVSGAGGAAGVLLGGLLTDLYGWRSVFAVLVPFALVVLLATWRLVEPTPPRGGRLDVPGAVTVIGGLVALTYGVTSAWPVALAGVALLAVFAVLQRRSRDPLLPSRMARVALPNALMAMLGAVWLGLFYFLPLYQQRTLGYTPMQAGLTQLPLALMITISSWATARLAGRAVLPAGLLVLAAGLAWLARTPAHGTFLADVLGPTLLIGAGLGVAFVRITALSSAGVPAEDSGLAGGLVNASRQVGGAVGLSALTLLPTYGGAFLACAVITLLMIGKATLS
ncbi:MFS transporter [Nonomuraea roseoviolacea]|uniref:EmrB/QacA subfamily drug resistance transporter n=1 Tax=Nonomuraea roseoviolacea subsp. carminata TaxID=160689 RepID=A0ABT1JYX4_9ACTN|nr:MFS transporter [Nonomuraea roseoviolacea]MCP2346948.1 EmrB/QacA subfamily drug resistance transporter [Nonomuraea roseoviolacea subsp. carminata]